MTSDRRQTKVWLGSRDRHLLEMIRQVYGISLSAAMRVAIRATSEKLGLEKNVGRDELFS